jgi:hypothetical protein
MKKNKPRKQRPNTYIFVVEGLSDSEALLKLVRAFPDFYASPSTVSALRDIKSTVTWNNEEGAPTAPPRSTSQ